MGEQLDRLVRTERRKRTLGSETACRLCGMGVPATLQADGRGVICYQCANAAHHRPVIEAHHPLGRANDQDTVINTPGNLHRMLDSNKGMWPEVVRNGAATDPLLFIVAVVLWVRDSAETLIVYAQAVVDFLLLLHGALVAKYGNEWRVALGLPMIWGPANSARTSGAPSR